MRFTYEKEYQFPELKEHGLVSTIVECLDYQFAINHRPGRLNEEEFQEYIEKELLKELKAKYGDITRNSPSHH